MTLPSAVDVVVVGGGPAGLAAALAARRKGLTVLVADRGRPPLDKACGEGLMPDGVAALSELGVELGPAAGVAFRGIRFIEDGIVAEAAFPGPAGLGIRRTRLHDAMAAHAHATGVITGWGLPVEGLDGNHVRLGGQSVRAHWIVGADGCHSRVRGWAGLHPTSSSARRIGVRRHVHCRPWTDFVEVYWRAGCQAYVTPVGPEEICIALVGSVPRPRFADLPTLFPALADRLGDAVASTPERGGLSISTRLGAVTAGRVALIGDAAGSIDAVAGEGLALAFREATALGAALGAGDLARYARAHRQSTRLVNAMAWLLLLLDRHDSFRRRVLRVLAARPSLFASLLAVHVGSRPAQLFGTLTSLSVMR